MYIISTKESKTPASQEVLTHFVVSCLRHNETVFSLNDAQSAFKGARPIAEYANIFLLGTNASAGFYFGFRLCFNGLIQV